MSSAALGMAWRSLNHSPKSSSLQRSQQNGRHGLSASSRAGRLHCGQGAVRGLFALPADGIYRIHFVIKYIININLYYIL